jgi:hypothetical protein
MANDSGQRRLLVTLALFRCFIGLLLIGQPWIVGNGLDGYGASSIGVGVAVIAAATQMHRAPWLRWVQAGLAFAVFFLPFAFGDDVIDSQIYCAVLLGKMLLITSIVSPDIFSHPTSEWHKDSDSSKSAAPNTSSVNTPPNPHW